MNEELYQKELDELKQTIADQNRRIRRMEAVNRIQNILARYAAYHAASDQTKTAELFCRHTPGIRLIFNGDIYDGWEGVERHFIYRMSNAEDDLSGRLYLHDMLSPLIEVAEDGMSAKCVIASHGCETGWNPDGSLKSLWAISRYRFDFLVEDGEWRIYRMEMHQVLNTPYEGKGWTENPCYDLIGNAPQALKDSTASNEMCQAQRQTKKPYQALRLDTPDCDIHTMRPEPPLPYDTYDFEGIKDEDDLDWHVTK